MDTEQLSVLLTAIEKGSFAAAAEYLNYTVSGVSRSVAALEQRLGFSLLHRSKQGVTPTNECEMLLPAMRELVFAEQKLVQTASRISGAETGTIVIGSSYSCYYPWLTRITASFRALHPASSSILSLVPVPLCSRSFQNTGWILPWPATGTAIINGSPSARILIWRSFLLIIRWPMPTQSPLNVLPQSLSLPPTRTWRLIILFILKNTIFIRIFSTPLQICPPPMPWSLQALGLPSTTRSVPRQIIRALFIFRWIRRR